MTRSLESLTEALLSAARRAGADAADALAVEGTSLSIDIRAGALEQAERSESIELGLRVLLGRRQACVSVSDISQATIDAVAERAVATDRVAGVGAEPDGAFIRRDRRCRAAARARRHARTVVRVA